MKSAAQSILFIGITLHLDCQCKKYKITIYKLIRTGLILCLKNNKKANDALIMLCYVCSARCVRRVFPLAANADGTRLLNGNDKPQHPQLLLLPAIIIAAAVILWLGTKKLTDGETGSPTDVERACAGFRLRILYLRG